MHTGKDKTTHKICENLWFCNTIKSLFWSAVVDPKNAFKAREARLRKNRDVWVCGCQRAFEVSNAQNHD
jgi:hypothetical protein